MNPTTTYHPLPSWMPWASLSLFAALPASLSLYAWLGLHLAGPALLLLMLAAIGLRIAFAVSHAVSVSRVHPGPWPIPLWIPWAAAILFALLPTVLTFWALGLHAWGQTLAFAMVTYIGARLTLRIASARFHSLTVYFKASGQI